MFFRRSPTRESDLQAFRPFRHLFPVIALLGLTAGAGAAAGAELWTPLSGSSDLRVVRLDPGVVAGLADARTTGLEVLAGDALYEVAVKAVRRNERGVVSIEGAVPGVEGSFLLLTVGKDGSAAALFGPSADERWRLHGSGGDLILERVDADAFQPCAGTPTELPPLVAGYAGVQGAAASGTADRAFGDVANDGSRHDLIVAWTPKTEALAGGAAQMQTEIQLAVDAANMVYAGSGIASRLRLVYAARTEYDEDTAWSYNDHLYAFANPADGVMDEVPALRTIVGADFMVLFVESVDATGQPIDACGVGYVMGADDAVPEFEILAVSVVSRRCAASVWTLAHEVGHNRGCAHNRENASVDGLTTYAYGHRFTGGDGQGYRTVMSYDTDPVSMTRIPRFANPSISWAGVATGIPVGDPGESHTSLVHAQTSLLCAGFRPERSFVDFDGTGPGTGFVDAPFATLEAGLAQARIGGQVVLQGNAPGYTGTLGDAGVLMFLGSGSSVLGAP